MQICEYFFENACYSVTKYYLCKQNNKRSLLGRKQRHQVVRSFPNRYLFSLTNKLTFLFPISCILDIILPCKRAAFGMQNNSFCNVLIIRKLRNRYSCEKYLHLCYPFSVYKIRENLSAYRIFKFYYFFASKLLLFLLLMKYGVISYIVSRFRSISF